MMRIDPPMIFSYKNTRFEFLRLIRELLQFTCLYYILLSVSVLAVFYPRQQRSQEIILVNAIVKIFFNFVNASLTWVTSQLFPFICIL